MEQARALVIGIGNRLRSDDGAGLLLAEALATEIPVLQVLLCDQPTPELAVAISRAEAVLFVDALVGAATEGPTAAVPQPRLEPIQATTTGDPAGHGLTPSGLLALSAALFGSCPPAWQLLIPGECWDVGDQLSPTAASACSRAMPLLREWGAAHA
jgi:hydrogenase maturation protease